MHANITTAKTDTSRPRLRLQNSTTQWSRLVSDRDHDHSLENYISGNE